MSIISKEDFTSLALFNNDVCVSIYIPTQRGGKDVLEGKNQRHLKSKWKDVKTRLEEKGVPKDKIDNIAKPVLKLIEIATSGVTSQMVLLYLFQKMFLNIIPFH